MNAGFAKNIAAALPNALQFQRIFRFVISGDSIGRPRLVETVAFADDDRRIADMANVEFISSDEDHAGRAARRARQAGRCLTPLIDVIPHFVVTRKETLTNGSENRLVIRRFRPEVFFFENVLTEMLTSELRRFFPAVTIEDTEIGQRDRTFFVRRIQSLKGNGISIL